MRAKEDAHDYRYFPEPDLPRITISSADQERQRALLPELPAARRERYRTQYGLSPYDAGVLCDSRALAEFYETVVRLSGKPKEAANWIANELLRNLNDATLPAHTIDSLPFKPFDVAELIKLVDGETISGQAGRKVLRAMFETSKGPRELAKELGLEQVNDSPQLEQWCREALIGKDKIIADVKAGKTKAVGALVGPVMKASKGSANPQAVQDILLRLIAAEH